METLSAFAWLVFYLGVIGVGISMLLSFIFVVSVGYWQEHHPS
ncbi:MAG: hypothetical protein RRB13_02135 [bacterium]|nr:hypothetical protein [bacterium]